MGPRNWIDPVVSSEERHLSTAPDDADGSNRVILDISAGAVHRAPALDARRFTAVIAPVSSSGCKVPIS